MLYYICTMVVLIVGNGGREHALAWKISQSSLCHELFIAPGNPGTALNGKNVAIDSNDFDALSKFCIENNVDLVVVGPETPLVNGIVDVFKTNPNTQHISIVGPSENGAQLEGSKAFAKEFMKKYQIPTARYIEVTLENISEAYEFFNSGHKPYVLKADGLAGGKGVIILDDENEARATLLDMLNGSFGLASRKVVIEEFLDGIEFSVFVLTDGNEYVLLPEAKDYKRIGEGDTGLNTGGMGAVSPVPFVTSDLMDKVVKKIIKPTIQGINDQEIDYKGFIFFGLILVNDEPFVIEYNCRLGDPETEAILPRINEDLLPLLFDTANGGLKARTLDVLSDSAVTIMLVSNGYPQKFKKGYPISNLDRLGDCHAFYAGVAINEKGDIITNGGRVVALTTVAKNGNIALENSRSAAEKVSFENKYFRRDIGFDLGIGVHQ